MIFRIKKHLLKELSGSLLIKRKKSDPFFMFKGNREPRVPRIEEENVDEEYDEIHNEYDEVGSDMEDINETIPVSAPVAGPMTIPKHISQTYVGNRQTMNLHVYFVGTPEQFENGDVSTVYRLSPSNSKYFQQNMATKNRMEAGDDMRFGDTRAIVPVAFNITNKQNTATFAGGFRCNKLENSSVNKDAGYLYVVPAKTKSQSCSVNVFKPNNIIEKRNYKLGTLCTQQDVDEHIIVKDGSKNGRSIGIGFVEAGTYSYDTLLHCYRKGMWRDQNLTQNQIDAMFEYEQNPNKAKLHAEVTPKMASDLKNFLMDRCVNINEITFSLERADGETNFNSPKNLIGTVVGSSLLGAPALKENNGVLSQQPKELSTVCSIGFDATMEFFPL
jgi:hypothetical protein